MATKASAGAPRIASPRVIGRFAGEFLVMCAAMCAGGGVLGAAVFGASSALGLDIVGSAPALAMLIVGINFAIAMGVLMAVQRHPWRHNLEMASTSVLAGALFAIADLAGLIRPETPLGWFSLFTLMCGPACVLMLIDMVFRFDHYTGRHAH